MMKVGGRDIVYSGVVHVLDGEEFSLICPLPDDDSLHLIFKFLDVSSPVVDDKTEQRASVTLVVDVADDGMNLNSATLEFANFNKSLGQGLKEPFIVAATNGREISVLATVYKFSTLKKVEFQVMVEAAL